MAFGVGAVGKGRPRQCRHRHSGVRGFPQLQRLNGQGAARVTLNELVRTVHENESIYIPIGATHRMENPGKIPLELIEVQTGSYLGEDDIIRIEDDYKRS